MNRVHVQGIRVSIGMVLTTLLMVGMAAAQSQVQGVITGRSGATMTVKTQTNESIVVALTPATQVQEVEGAFKLRKEGIDDDGADSGSAGTSKGVDE